MAKTKVGIIGAGAVGATTAYTLSILGICDEIILFDIADGVAKGKAIDIGQASHYTSKGINIIAAQTPSDIKDCNVVIVTAGVPRKGNMTREDLLMINAKITKDVVQNIKINSPKAIIICVSNPLDVMTYVTKQITGWDSNRIIGLAGALDGSRMAYQIQKITGLNLNQIGNLVIGDHGENMIPLPHKVSIADIPLENFISQDDMQAIIQRTKNGGAEIVKHLGTSGYYGPGRAIAYMVEAILNDSKIIVSSSTVLNGEYGYKDVAVGVPVVLGSQGVEKIIELDLDEQTKEKFDISVKSIQDGINILIENNFFVGE